MGVGCHSNIRAVELEFKGIVVIKKMYICLLQWTERKIAFLHLRTRHILLSESTDSALTQHIYTPQNQPK